MATEEEIAAFRAQENLKDSGISIVPQWMRDPIDHAGLGNLEWLADFQGGTGPNILVEDQETFTRPEIFANVIGPYIVTPDELESRSINTPFGKKYNPDTA